MLIIKHHKKTKPIISIETQLKELSLAYKIEIDPSVKELILIEGKKEIIGVKNINEYLEELAIEIIRERNHGC